MAPTPEVTGYSDLVEVGRGGFARVYRAHQDRFNRSVALKVLNLADPDERTRTRFERECQAMGELSWHPHVVAVYDSGVTEDGHLWLAMEYVQRGSLADTVGGSTLDWPSAAAAGIEVCGALGAAHAAGTLHRDLKPENVLVGPFGEAKLADFGIAAVDGGRRTTTGVANFTVAHVAPEVLRGQRQDERTDVYGLASTLHTLLAGRPPFAGDQDEPVAAVMMRIIDTAPPRLGDPVPDDLADLIVAGLAKEPDDRPQSAAVLGEALQAIQQRHGQPVTPLRLTGAATTAAPPVPVVPPAADAAPPDVAPPPAAGDDRATIVADPPAVIAAEPDTGAPAVPDADETITVATPATGAVPPVPAPPPTPADPEPVAPTPTPATDIPSGSGGRRRILLISAAVVVVILVIGGAVFVLGGGDGDEGGGGEDVAEGTFKTEAFATTPAAVAVNDDAVWVTDAADSLLYKLDPETGEEITNTGMNNTGTGIALTDDDAGWVTGDDTSELIRIDLLTNQDTDQVEVGEGQQSISAVGTDVWIARGFDGDVGSVVRFDAVNQEPVTEIEVGTAPNHVAATDDVVWVASTSDDTVSRIDPDLNEVVEVIELEVEPAAIAAVEDAVWVVSTDSSSLTRIDPATNEIVTVIDLDQNGGAAPNAVAATAGAVWVTDLELDLVYLIDPASNEIIDDIPVGHEPVAVAATDADAWVANSGDGSLTHIDPAAFT